MLPDGRHWPGGQSARWAVSQAGIIQVGFSQVGISQGYCSLQAGGAEGCIWSANAALEPGFSLGRIKSGDKVTLPFMRLTHLVTWTAPAGWGDSRHGLPRPGDGWQ